MAGRAGRRALAPGHRCTERHLVCHAGPLIRARIVPVGRGLGQPRLGTGSLAVTRRVASIYWHRCGVSAAYAPEPSTTTASTRGGPGCGAASASIRRLTLCRGRSASSPGEPRGDPGRATTASVKNGSSMAGAAFRRMVGTCVLVSPDRPCLMLRTAAMARSTCLRPTGPARVLEVNDGAATVSTGWVSRGPVNHLERERSALFKQFECVRSGFAAAVRRRRGCSAARPGTAPCTARSA